MIELAVTVLEQPRDRRQQVFTELDRRQHEEFESHLVADCAIPLQRVEACDHDLLARRRDRATQQGEVSRLERTTHAAKCCGSATREIGVGVAVSERVVAGDLASATMITVARGVEWHARYNRGRLLSGARALLDALPSTLDFRLRAALVEGAQRAFRGQTEYDEWSDDDPWLDALVIELKTARGTPDATLTTVETAMAELNAASVKTGSAYMLVSKLVEADLAMASAVIERGRDPQSPWRGFAYLGVREILERDLPRGRAIIDAALATGDDESDIAGRAAAALGGVRRPLEPADLALLRRALSAPREEVVIAGLNALQWDRSISDEMAFELLMLTPIELSENLLATVARLLEDRHRKLYHLLTEHDVTILLDRLRHVRTIEGSHWILELFQYLAVP